MMRGCAVRCGWKSKTPKRTASSIEREFHKKTHTAVESSCSSSASFFSTETHRGATMCEFWRDSVLADNSLKESRRRTACHVCVLELLWERSKDIPIQ